MSCCANKNSDCGGDHHKDSHVHGPGCGHTAIRHCSGECAKDCACDKGCCHVDYLHDGHMHHKVECKDGCGKGCACEKECCSKYHDCEGIKVSNTNPTGCSGGHECASHDASHVHGPDCGHPQVIHDGHVDYVVDGHLHHPCGDGHCCSHGPVTEI